MKLLVAFVAGCAVGGLGVLYAFVSLAVAEVRGERFQPGIMDPDDIDAVLGRIERNA